MSLKKQKHLPVQGTSTIKEEDSRIEFERRIHPWKFVPFGQTHAAVDGTVETSYEDSSKTRLFSGRRFTVQLKLRSTIKFTKSHASTRVDVKDLNNWMNSFEPVVFVLYDKESNQFYFQFIDDILIQSIQRKNPKWIAQKSTEIQLSLENRINSDGLVKIESLLANHKTKSTKTLTPGTYFESKEKLSQIVSDCLKELQSRRIPYGADRLNEIAQNINTAIYTVTVVGETSVGKSTLVNALLSKQISPMDKYPTTGIPCTFQPGEKEYAEVVFKDGKRKKIPATDKALNDYVTQQGNSNNHRNVDLVTVSLVDQKLESGLAYCDVPGLNDPDERIEKIAKSAIFSSNAIIYIIDGMPMKGGGFFLKRNQIEDLKDLKFRRDRLFLVVNKVDFLNKRELAELKFFLEKELKKYGADQLLSHPPIYVSAKKSFEKRVKGKGDDNTILELEKVLWTYLLQSGKTGLHNLLGLTSEFIDEVGKTSTVINARMLDSDKRIQFQLDLTQTRKDLEKLNAFGKIKKDELMVWMTNYINDSINVIISNLQNWLTSFNTEQNLPSTKEIKRYLQNEATIILSDIFSEVNFALDNLYSETNEWVKNKLSQTEMEIDKYSDPNFLLVSDFNHLITPISRNFNEDRHSAVNMLEGALFFIGDLASTFFIMIEELLLGKVEVRKKHVHKILAKARISYTSVFQNARALYGEYVNNQYSKILTQIQVHAKVYLGNIDAQLNKLDEELSDTEKMNYEKFFEKRKEFVLEARRIIIQYQQNIVSNSTHKFTL